MSTVDTERYVRITLLTFEGGLWIARKIINREVGSNNLDRLLLKKKMLLKSRRDITDTQFETLFPTSGNGTDIDTWDLTLLVKIIKILFSLRLNLQDDENLDKLLGIRNDVCHASQPSLSEQEFNKHWTKLTTCIVTLASQFDGATTQHASKLTERLSTEPLDLHSSINQIAQLCRNDELMENMLKCLAKQERILNEVASGVTSANNKLDAVLKTVRDIKRNQFEKEGSQCLVSVDLPVLGSKVCISGDDYTAVTAAADVVYKNFKSVAEKEDDPMSDRTAVQEFTADIESQGAVIESVEKGSIILKIRCKNLDGLIKILSLFRDNGNKYRLVGIESALNSILHSNVKVELVLPDNTIEMLKEWLDKCWPERRETPFGTKPLVHKRHINLGIKCNSAEAAEDVIKYLKSDTSANRLNQIADSVSKMVGDKIKIDVEPDLEGFTQALVIRDAVLKQKVPKQHSFDRPVRRRQRLVSLVRDKDFKAIAGRFTSFGKVEKEIRKIVDTDMGLILGIDYTMHSRTQGQQASGDRKVHQISVDAVHPYQEVICFLGETLELFDDNGTIPTFGFGYVEKEGKGMFPWLEEEECAGFHDVLDFYNKMAQNINLVGPTNFAPLIKKAVGIVEQKKQFHILVVVTDGHVDCENETMDAIVQASHYPLSIVVIWVGDGPCYFMDEFMDRVPERRFDNVQIVDFHAIKAVAKNLEAAVGLAVLMKIPDQYNDICSLDLFSKLG